VAARKKATPKQSNSEGGVLHLLIAIGLGTLGLVTAFGLVWWQILVQPQQAQFDQVKQQMLQYYSGYFNGRVNDLRAQVGAMTTAPATAATLATFDEAAIRATADRLRQENPYILRVDLIQKGEAQVDMNAEIPISFAALDLMRRAETREFVGPEVSLNQRNLIYAAQPITSNGVVTGVLLAVYSTNFFLTPLNQYDATMTSLKVEQKFDGNPKTVVMQWGATEGDGAPLTAGLIAPHWQLSYGAKKGLLTSITKFTDLLVPAGVAWLAMVGGFFLAFSRQNRIIAEDAAELTDYATRLLRGRAARLATYNLKPLAEAAATLSKFVKKQSAAQPQDDDLLDDLNKNENENENIDQDQANEQTESDAEDNFLGVRRANPKDNFGIEVNEEERGSLGIKLDPSIFRAYDIRGITTTNLTEDVVYWIGRAFAAQASAQQQTRVVVGRDGRHSSSGLELSLTSGLVEGGVDVISVGLVPTPLLYYATFALDTGTGIMITGSHNPPDYNGLKMMIDGVTLAEDTILALLERVQQNDLSEGEGSREEISLDDSYVDKVLDDVAVAQPLKVVVDCGNGVAGKIAPRLLQELGCEVVPLYCDVDGDFPNHHPDPAEPQNLEDLKTVVAAENADIGLAFDGDGDRLGVVTPSGEIIWPDKLLMLFAQDIVSRNPGAEILYDVKCSRHLNTIISDLGGRPIMWKTGHSHMKAKLKETGALLAGEFSGHICFGERWYGFDDALYSAARLLEILGSEGRSIDEVFAQFPATFTTPEIKIETTDEAKFDIMSKLSEQADFGDGTLTTIDGIRVDFNDGWGLVRPSNTSPVLSLRFEADTPEALNRIQGEFQEQLFKIDAALSFKD
jgi:phosphomannomutase/phosphoglucomutase